jgi:hypothetical protein
MLLMLLSRTLYALALLHRGPEQRELQHFARELSVIARAAARS